VINLNLNQIQKEDAVVLKNIKMRFLFFNKNLCKFIVNLLSNLTSVRNNN